MSSVSDIKDQLVVILGAVSGVEQVLDYLPRYIDKYNTIGIHWDGGTFEPAEIGSHWAHYKFKIKTALCMLDEKTVQEEQENLALLELSALRAKPSLNNTCLKHSIEEIRNEEPIIAGNGNIYGMMEITLIADVEEDD
ncbi:MAG: hypothetical protein PHW73_01315 [Atribacterota bacterium]|nr:hypothetical protein [Atribacterota bacterium]